MNTLHYAGMAELADALASGASSRKGVEVQVLLPAPYDENALDSVVRFRGVSF